MKPAALLAAALLLSILLFALVPHHARRAGSRKPRTLAAVYAELQRQSVNDRPEPRFWLLLATAAGVTAAFSLPLALTTLAWSGSRPLLAVLALVTLAGAAVNLIAMVLSHISFGFGSSRGPRDETWGFWAILATQGATAAASFVLALAPTWTTAAHRWLSD